MKAKPFFLIVLTGLLLLQSRAQQRPFNRPDGLTLKPASVDKIIQGLMDSADVPGLCLGIVSAGKPGYVKSYGFKNMATGRRNDTATCFYAASLAKPLFAYLVMQLVDEEKINLDRPLAAYLPKPLPQFENYKDLAGDERWKLLTARHCLSHTTGFPNWRFLDEQKGAFDTAGKLAIHFPPGQRYAYSGEGLVLLQLVVETITGQPLEELAQAKIFRPFGMRRTGFLWRSSFESDYAVGHSINGDAHPKQRAKEANAAGSMETTIADYTRFMAAVLQGKGLSEKSRNEMFAQQIPIYTKRQFPSLNSEATDSNRTIGLAYGLGWGLFQSRYGKAFFKEGHGQGWQHYTVAFPEKGYAVILITNSDNGESLFAQAVNRLTGVVIPYEWEGYCPFQPFVKVPLSVLKQYAGVYDGRLRALVTVENGGLMVESKTVGLPKTKLYATNEAQFFLKVMDTRIQFIKGKDGWVEKAVLDDEGEHYELKKIK